MFHKVFNVYAAEHHLYGSNGKITYYSDLMYNKKNWRDMDKDKTVTRQEAITAEKKEKQEAINTYYVQKAIALIRKIQKSARLMIAGVMEKLRRFIIYFQNHNFHRLLIMLKI